MKNFNIRNKRQYQSLAGDEGIKAEKDLLNKLTPEEAEFYKSFNEDHYGSSGSDKTEYGKALRNARERDIYSQGFQVQLDMECDEEGLTDAHSIDSMDRESIGFSTNNKKYKNNLCEADYASNTLETSEDSIILGLDAEKIDSGKLTKYFARKCYNKAKEA